MEAQQLSTHKRAGAFKMRRYMRKLAVLLVALVTLGLGTASPSAWAKGEMDEMPLDDAKMIIEFNSTDEDVGIQVFLDGEAWKEMTILTPDARRIFKVRGEGSVKGLGLTELFFESEEPSLDELPLEEFLALFPEGDYEFEGVTVDGIELEGAATFTHVIPAGPVVVWPTPGAVLDPNDAMIMWEPVTSTVTGSPAIEIVGYQVIVEQEEPLRVFSVDLPASATRVTVPPEFLQPGTPHKFEVLAIEVSGNQTISESTLTTSP